MNIGDKDVRKKLENWKIVQARARKTDSEKSQKTDNERGNDREMERLRESEKESQPMIQTERIENERLSETNT